MRTAHEIFQFLQDLHASEDLIYNSWETTEVDPDVEQKLEKFLNGEIELKPEETINLTIGEIFERGLWDECGVDEWCLNEGRANKDDEVRIPESKALKFMSYWEFHRRKK